MHVPNLSLALTWVWPWLSSPASARAGNFAVEPFKVNVSAHVPHLRLLLQHTTLPDAISQYPGDHAGVGMRLDVLKSLQQQWLTAFDWEKEQRQINTFQQYTTTIEGLSIHFVHEKSEDPDAIPLLMAHGWPGSFLDFLPVVKDLTQAARTSTGRKVSFNVVVPSLPGFAFSSAPGPVWSCNDTARVFNTLMVDVLGYSTYAVHGTDFGGVISWHLYDAYNSTARALHSSFLPFGPLLSRQLAAEDISVTDELELFELKRSDGWVPKENGFFLEQLTKPNTVALTAYDNPIGQLTWLGEKIIDWSDPRRGTGPSVLTDTEILRSVSMYYLTQTYLSSLYIYAQNPPFWSRYVKAQTDAPMLLSVFKYNLIWWPREVAAQVGNLVLYSNHDFGGHFPSLDNPSALCSDIRELGNFWEGPRRDEGDVQNQSHVEL